MPKYEETIDVNGLDAESILAISYSALQQLKWKTVFASENELMASTPKSWGSYDQEIIITSANDQLNVSSEMVHGEVADLRGKNKKHVADFFAAFRSLQNTISPETIAQNIAAINELRAKTKHTVEQQVKDAKEVDAAMRLSGSNLYVTYAIIGINVLVFILMVINGAGFMLPDGSVHIKWGSNFTPLTESGDWWRLITNIFIHFGIIHLVMNMYCLYMAGVYLEPMLGKIKYTVAYLSTGVLASIASLWWHKEGVNSAGASGAIFGLYGLFLALLLSNLIPKSVRDSLLKSIGIFIFYNLVYGMKSGVDNSAHIGGLISGFALGLIYMFAIKKERQGLKVSWVLPVVIFATIGISYAFLQNNKADSSIRNEYLQTLNGENGDIDKYNDKNNEVVALQETALQVLQDTTLTDAEMRKKLREVSMPLWENAEVMVRQMQQMNVNDHNKKKAEYLLEYILLRKEEVSVIIHMIDTNDQTPDKLIETRNKIDSVISLIK